VSSRRTFNVMTLSAAVSAMRSQIGRAENVTKAQSAIKAKNVVLVHGLYADGSSWLEVIGHLQNADLNATAVQNPLPSLEEDSAATRRILASQNGPTVLVGHSFAGTIISETGDDPSSRLWSTWPLARPTQVKTSERSQRSFQGRPRVQEW
jgi:pimeloyl-ACP methyl ester carboxylesterase